MKITKILNSFIVAILVGLGASSLSNSASKTKAVFASDVVTPTESGKELYGYDENASTDEVFKVNVQQSTHTDTSHSFTMKFMSSIRTLSTSLSTFDGKLKGVYVATDDPECPSDKTLKELTKYDFDPANPNLDVVEVDSEGKPVLNVDGTYNFVPDKDGVIHDYKFKIPTYEGYVYRIDPSDTQKTVIIPNYIVRQDRYRIHVTTIGANVFDYRLQSDNTEKDLVRGLQNIIIGQNITTFTNGAFVGKESEMSNLNINICGSDEGRVYGANWNGFEENFEGHEAKANVTFNYDLSNDLANTDVSKIKKVFSDDFEKDENGDVIYYDNNGYRIDGEGHYLNDNGEIDSSKNAYDGVPLTNIGATIQSYATTKEYSSKNTIVFGDKLNNRPMVLEYKVTNKDGGKETRFYEFPSSENSYTGVGTAAGLSSTLIYVDLHINSGDVVDDESLVIHNLFSSKNNAEVLSPDLNVEYKCIPEKGFASTLSLNNFISVSPKSIHTFGKYTAFTIAVDKVEGAYELINPVSYKAYKDKIASGAIKVRSLFTNFAASTYSLTFVKNGELVTKDVSFNDSSAKGLTLSFHLLNKDKGNKVTFLLRNDLIDDDFNASTVRRVEYKAVLLKMDLMSTKKSASQTITKSGAILRFGYFDILPPTSKAPKSFDGGVFLIVATATYILAYLLLAGSYYAYAKNKYKNDEFRRMNTKKYLKTVSFGFVGTGIIVEALLFIFLRFALFNVSVVVYNPLDPLVIIFGVVAIVMIGIFAKKLYTSIKVSKERRQAIKLKLNEDVADDGTK